MGKSKPFSSLGPDLKVLELLLEERSIEQVRRTAVVVGSSVIRATPVDTGRARGNWQPSINSPITGTGPLKGSGDAISALQAVASSFKKGSLFLTNNLPYINRLNNGWSQQQSIPGWIERLAVNAFKSVRKKWWS